MNSPWCARCGELQLSTRHACPPRWEVEIDYRDDPVANDWDEAGEAFATTPEVAATKWAEKRDMQGDYSIVGGSPARLRLRRADVPDDPWVVMIVCGRSEPVYTAEPERPPRKAVHAQCPSEGPEA